MLSNKINRPAQMEKSMRLDLDEEINGHLQV